MARKIIVVLGPTASGKSDIALKLAKQFNGFLISADSRQVFRGMDIGTNKDKGEWRAEKFYVAGIEECLVGVVEPNEYFSVEDWLKSARKVMAGNKSRIPIIVGGTGLYISALIYNYDFPGKYDKKLRQKFEALIEKRGLAALLDKMRKIDPDIEEKIDMKNPRRVARALEILFQTRRPLERAKMVGEYDVLQIGINLLREKLYEKINARVEQMMADGLVDEVRTLVSCGYNCQSSALSGIGYREICDFLNHKISGQKAIELIQQNTRRYAKRQITWFKRDKNIHWVNDYQEAVELVKDFFR